MAKKQSKHSRAARRNVEELNERVFDDAEDQQETSNRESVLEHIAVKSLREKGGKSSQVSASAVPPAGMDELTAIALGVHPEQAPSRSPQPASRVGKQSAKKNQRSKKKQQRAEMVKDMLDEKIGQSRIRHKTIRAYRNKDESEESGTSK